MGRKSDETYQKYKERVLDTISPSFCAAKWYNTTIWLESGKTTSCHHPPAHDISLNEILQDPACLHNTMLKKVERSLMLKGSYPPGCDYCWKLEEAGDDIISDRVFKTEIYHDDDVLSLESKNPRSNINPKTIELSFSSKCHLACCYCNSSFSSKWKSDIKKFGFFNNLAEEDGERINHYGNDKYENREEDNPYIRAFWEWWPKLQNDLQELRITGGEPFLSENTWKLIDIFSNNEKLINTTLAINSNLMLPIDSLERLVEYSKTINNLDIYTSCEAVDQHAEYIRDGLVYKKFIENCRYLLGHAKLKSFNIMLTINILSAWSLVDFLDEILLLKYKFQNYCPITFSVNILRFPTFLQIVNLPTKYKQQLATQLNNWLVTNDSKLVCMEVESIKRLASYLQVGSCDQFNKLDLLSFLDQYDYRRNKNFRVIFPKLAEWLDEVKEVK